MAGALLERVRERVVTRSAVVGVLILEPVERWIGRRSPVGDTPFGRRVVLFLDVVRPLTGVARHLNFALPWVIAHSPLVRDARRRQESWTAEVAARRAATPA